MHPVPVDYAVPQAGCKAFPSLGLETGPGGDLGPGSIDKPEACKYVAWQIGTQIGNKTRILTVVRNFS
jgi:hypothetical protein